MSGLKVTNAAMIDDARSLLDMLLAGSLRDLHVASESVEIFIAREGGRPNPMRASAALPPKAPPSSLSTGVPIVASHVATFVRAAPVGTEVAEGQPAATISVLDVEEPVFAPKTGRICQVHPEPGDLIEFGEPIVSFEVGA